LNVEVWSFGYKYSNAVSYIYKWYQLLLVVQYSGSIWQTILINQSVSISLTVHVVTVLLNSTYYRPLVIFCCYMPRPLVIFCWFQCLLWHIFNNNWNIFLNKSVDNFFKNHKIRSNTIEAYFKGKYCTKLNITPFIPI
jgi:hypothetical protein